MAAVGREPFRIAFFSDALWFGGAEKYLLLLAASLDRDAYRPELIVSPRPSLDGFAAAMAEARVSVHRVALDMFRSPAGIRRFVSLLRLMRPSILHCNLPGPWGAQYSLAAPLARLAGVRHVVTTEHLPMIRPFAKGEALRRFGSRWIERVLTVSEDNVRYLVERHGVPREKIRVVRIGIPEPVRGEPARIREKLGIPREDFLCAMVARLEERKGHAIAIEALAALPGGVQMLVAGEGEGEAALRAEAADLGLGRRVHFLGHRDDVSALLAECDALVLTSTLEATPYVLIEAMAAGLPVVASGIFGIPEIVRNGETGFLIDPRAREDVARAVAVLAADRDRSARMGAAGRKRYEAMFRIERCVAETQAVYRELLRSDSKSLM